MSAVIITSLIGAAVTVILGLTPLVLPRLERAGRDLIRRSPGKLRRN